MKRYLAEFIGTFALVFAGTGAIVINDVNGGVITHVGIALTFGLVVMAMIYAIGDLSGAHINPAVTFGFAMIGKLPWKEVIPYILSQLFGALFASLFLKFVYPLHPNLGATIPSISPGSALIFETILTFLLIFVIFHVSSGSKEKGLMAGVAIGGTVALEAMFAGPATGASMNPARSIAPALVSGQMDLLWIYITGPLLGVFLMFLKCRFIKDETCCKPE